MHNTKYKGVHLIEKHSGVESYASGRTEAEKVLTAGVDAIVVGAGFAGAVVARELAERGNKKVLVLEQRPHVGGNAYDCFDDAGVLIHAYGPHIFHTNSERAFEYLSRFTAWRDYQHEVLADIHGTYTPVPFNFNSIEQHFPPEKAAALIERLTRSFGADAKVPIIELRRSEDPLLAELADFVYENVFLYYTLKQWGLKPEEVDPSVTARVPVYTGRDNRYFTDTWQGMPHEGYTPLFDALLAHDNITVVLDVDACEILSLREGGEQGDSITGEAAPAAAALGGTQAAGGASPAGPAAKADAGDTPGVTGTVPAAKAEAPPSPFVEIAACGKPFTGTVVYTGPLDILAQKRFGLLPYRSLDFVYRTLDQRHFQPVGTVNYTVSEDYTRITEFTWLTGQDLPYTTIMEEYPLAFEDSPGQVPYYPIISPENQEAYERYLALFSALPNFSTLGRLADYRYFNMDQIVDRALELADRLCTSSDSDHLSAEER